MLIALLLLLTEQLAFAAPLPPPVSAAAFAPLSLFACGPLLLACRHGRSLPLG